MLDDLEADDDGDEVQDLKLDSSQDDSSELLSDDDNIESIPKVREDGLLLKVILKLENSPQSDTILYSHTAAIRTFEVVSCLPWF